MAQNSITVMGSVTPCNGTSYLVSISSTSGLDTVVATNILTCSYSFTFHPVNLPGEVLIALSCDTGATWVMQDSAFYTNPIDTIVANLSCGVPSCQACFTTTQTAPFTATFTSCSTGGTAPFTYLWDFSDAGAEPGNPISHVYPGPGTYGVCLNIQDANGNMCQTCEAIVVDANGTISPSVPPTCNANFWTLQAYDSTGTGGVESIPNEVWVWNLSTGGSGDAQYLWTFGDGSSSTDAYPTHEYDGPGPWDLCLTIYSGNCTDSYCDSVSVDENGILNGMVIEGHPADQNQRTNGFTLNVLQSEPTGIAETSAIADLRLFPNPAQNELNLSFNNALSGTVSVMVIDLTGRTVISESQNMALGVNTLRLNTSDLQPGLYMVRIGNDARSVTHRFLKVQ